MNPNAILTKTENETLELIAWGATKKDIARRRCRSVRTVENTARNIYRKIEVTKNSEMAAWYFCKTYHISFDLSPLVKSIVAIFFVLLTISAELTKVPVIRTRTLKTAQVRTRKNEESDYLFNS